MKDFNLKANFQDDPNKSLTDRINFLDFAIHRLEAIGLEQLKKMR
jgi:hypothetical protein